MLYIEEQGCNADAVFMRFNVKSYSTSEENAIIAASRSVAETLTSLIAPKHNSLKGKRRKDCQVLQVICVYKKGALMAKEIKDSNGEKRIVLVSKDEKKSQEQARKET